MPQVIKSYHQILNLKEKHLDTAVLNALVLGLREIEQSKDENKTENVNKLRAKLLELFGRLTSQVGILLTLSKNLN